MSRPASKPTIALPDINSAEARKMMTVLTGLVCLLVGWLVLRPAWSETRDLRQQTQQLQQQTRQHQANLEALQRALTKEGRGLAESLLVALPLTFDSSAEYARLGRLADRVGAQLNSFQPGSAVPAGQGNYQRFTVNLHLTCRFEHCLRFLGGLRGMVRTNRNRVDTHGPLWTVDQLSLTKGAEEGVLSMNLTAAVFMLPPASNPNQQPNP